MLHTIGELYCSGSASLVRPVLILSQALLSRPAWEGRHAIDGKRGQSSDTGQQQDAAALTPPGEENELKWQFVSMLGIVSSREP